MTTCGSASEPTACQHVEAKINHILLYFNLYSILQQVVSVIYLITFSARHMTQSLAPVAHYSTNVSYVK